ncbi:MAG: HI0074 family nucleotidyltransferase substrate-binding subunit [bacterium]
MGKSKFSLLLSQFKKAVLRLDEVLKQEKNDFMRDSAIQRFEFTFDLAWKAVKAYLEEERGVICNSPKGCFRDAYQQKIIENDEFWLEITDARDRTSHTYEEITAEEVYQTLPKSLEYFKKLLEKLQDNS